MNSIQSYISSPVFEYLKNGYIHITSKENFDLIMKDGFIKSNKNDLDESQRFKYSHSQSKNSGVRLLGLISLFDFDKPNEDIIFASSSFPSILNLHKEFIAIRFNKKDIETNIVSNSDIWKLQTFQVLCPKLEVGYKGNLSLDESCEIFLASKMKKITTIK